LRSLGNDKDFEEEKETDKFLMVLFFLIFAVFGYSLTHLLVF
jgi:hypothetical protein